MQQRRAAASLPCANSIFNQISAAQEKRTSLRSEIQPGQSALYRVLNWLRERKQLARSVCFISFILFFLVINYKSNSFSCLLLLTRALQCQVGVFVPLFEHCLDVGVMSKAVTGCLKSQARLWLLTATNVQPLNLCLLASPASFLLISPQELIIQKSFLLLQSSDNSERGCAG